MALIEEMAMAPLAICLRLCVIQRHFAVCQALRLLLLNRAAARIGIGVAVERILSLPSCRWPSISLKVSSRCTVTTQSKSTIIVECLTKHSTTCYQAAENMLPITRNYSYCSTESKALILWCIDIVRLTSFSLGTPGKNK